MWEANIRNRECWNSQRNKKWFKYTESMVVFLTPRVTSCTFAHNTVACVTFTFAHCVCFKRGPSVRTLSVWSQHSQMLWPPIAQWLMSPFFLLNSWYSGGFLLIIGWIRCADAKSRSQHRCSGFDAWAILILLLLFSKCLLKSFLWNSNMCTSNKR